MCRPSSAAADGFADRYRQIREQTESLCAPLMTEDYVVQSMPDVSPTKWHLAHTTWFYETFLLLPHASGYVPVDPRFAYLFNSYYVTVGDRHCRQHRGLLSRPAVSEIRAYRRRVDDAMLAWLAQVDDGQLHEVAPLIELGLHHEQQHQELMLTDIKHVFWANPLHPAYRATTADHASDARSMQWIGYPGGVCSIGHRDESFCFDNELPAHRVLVQPFALASRLVTNGEYRRFVDAGGYDQAPLWLSDGWATVQQERWRAPLYWIEHNGDWLQHTLGGVLPLDDHQPVCHLSYFEADAFARWAGVRLPTEAEWEIASAQVPIEGNFAETARYQPAAMNLTDGRAAAKPALHQMFGDAWEWTQSSYSPYPGYTPLPGAVGEYNGKFMCNQFVLRGGSCVTPAAHIRRTYRNFFPPAARWQFTGLRLGRNV